MQFEMTITGVSWVNGLQETICEASSFEKPFVNEADGRGEKQTATYTIQQALRHDNLQGLYNVVRFNPGNESLPSIPLTVLEKAAPTDEATTKAMPTHIMGLR